MWFLLVVIGLFLGAHIKAAHQQLQKTFLCQRFDVFLLNKTKQASRSRVLVGVNLGDTRRINSNTTTDTNTLSELLLGWNHSGKSAKGSRWKTWSPSPRQTRTHGHSGKKTDHRRKERSVESGCVGALVNHTRRCLNNESVASRASEEYFSKSSSATAWETGWQWQASVKGMWRGSSPAGCLWTEPFANWKQNRWSVTQPCLG